MCIRDSYNADKTIAVVHNGIIENYKELKEFLGEKGYEFYSETDTEVIPKLIDYLYEDNIENAVMKATDCLLYTSKYFNSLLS